MKTSDLKLLQLGHMVLRLLSEGDDAKVLRKKLKEYNIR